MGDTVRILFEWDEWDGRPLGFVRTYERHLAILDQNTDTSFLTNGNVRNLQAYAIEKLKLKLNENGEIELGREAREDGAEIPQSIEAEVKSS